MQSHPPSGKNFLLGVGCQKGGTTWLHHCLSQSPQVDFGFRKEYHIFDALFLPERAGYLQRTLDQAREMIAAMPAHRKNNPDVLRLLQFYRDPNSYFEYFHYLALRGPDIRLVGDITPSYATLPATVFREIRAGILRHGMGVKALFVLRDPVDRLYSMLRYRRVVTGRAAQDDHGPEKPSDWDVDRALIRFSEEAHNFHRSRYDLIIPTLESVFAPNEIHYAFFETLFTERALAEICAFVEISPPEAPDFDTKLNSAAEVSRPSDATMDHLVEKFADVYRFTADRFGVDRVRALWPRSRAVL